MHHKGEALAAEARRYASTYTGTLAAPITRELMKAHLARWLYQQDSETNSDTIRATFDAAMRSINAHA
jgi:hypothetical protein